jgi:hypothetical protein
MEGERRQEQEEEYEEWKGRGKICEEKQAEEEREC